VEAVFSAAFFPCCCTAATLLGIRWEGLCQQQIHVLLAAACTTLSCAGGGFCGNVLLQKSLSSAGRVKATDPSSQASPSR
jgi:hypothetical protein